MAIVFPASRQAAQQKLREGGEAQGGRSSGQNLNLTPTMGPLMFKSPKTLSSPLKFQLR